MFGIFYLIANTIGMIGSGTIAAKENYDAKQRSYEKQRQGKNRAGVYIDRLGATRDLSTGKRVAVDNKFFAEAKGKDAYVYNEKGQPIRNLSSEIRNESYRKAIKSKEPGKTVTLWKHRCDYAYVGRDGNSYAWGDQFKDLRNGAIYVCRFLDFPKEITTETNAKGEFYMDIRSGLLVRESDAQKIKRSMGKYRFSEELNKKFIDYFNEKQSTEGYLHKSKNPDSPSETELGKRRRMGWFYCNDCQGFDIL